MCLEAAVNPQLMEMSSKIDFSAKIAPTCKML